MNDVIIDKKLIVEYSDEGYISKEYFIDQKGNRQGCFKDLYSRSSVVMILTNYVNNMEHGLTIRYHRDGSIESCYNYDNGLVVGRAYEWDKSGKLFIVEHYNKLGLRNGISHVFKYSSTFGNLHTKRLFKNGKIVATKYYVNGQLVENAHWWNWS